MSQGTNYKNMYHLAFVGYFLLAIVFYRYVCQPLWAQFNRIQNLSAQSSDRENIQSILIKKRQELDALNKRVFKFDLKHDVFGSIIDFCDENRLILDYKEPEESINDAYAISTHNIMVEGEFKKIVALVYEIEREIGWVDYCSIYTEEVRRNGNKKPVLRSNIQFRNTTRNE